MKLSSLNEDEFEDDDSIYDELSDKDVLEHEERRMEIHLDNGPIVEISEATDENYEYIYYINGDNGMQLYKLVDWLIKSASGTICRELNQELMVGQFCKNGILDEITQELDEIKHEIGEIGYQGFWRGDSHTQHTKILQQALLDIHKAKNNKEMFERLPKYMQQNYVEEYIQRKLDIGPGTAA